VGFIQKLPTQLVAAFRATLEEINEADLLLHVVDVTQPHAMTQVRAVEETLRGLEAGDIPQVVALNKIDRLAQLAEPAPLAFLENAVPISALTGQGLEALLARVEEMLYDQMVPVQVRLPYSAGDLLTAFHQQGSVERIQHLPDGVHVTGRLPGRLVVAYRPYLLAADEGQ
jgi:GTP-binding protein HflX